MMESSHCPNCEAPLYGSFCANCGQNQKGSRRMLMKLINEAFEDLFKVDSRARKTTWALLFKPGFLSLEYFAGRRARYVQPLRLYIITSIAFFLLLSVINFFSDKPMVQVTGGEAVTVIEVDAEKAAELEEAREKGKVEIPHENSDKVEALSTEEIVAQAGDSDITVNIEEAELDIGDLDLPFLDDATKERYRVIAERQARKAGKLFKEDPGSAFEMAMDLAPPVIFCLLPLFALMLKIFYFFKGMYYTEHLVFAVHNHCFLFAAMICYTLLPLIVGESLVFWPQLVILIWIPVYLLKSMKTYYQQSWPLTIIKYFILAISYNTLLGLGIAAAIVFGVMTL